MPMASSQMKPWLGLPNRLGEKQLTSSDHRAPVVTTGGTCEAATNINKCLVHCNDQRLHCCSSDSTSAAASDAAPSQEHRSDVSIGKNRRVCLPAKGSNS